MNDRKDYEDARNMALGLALVLFTGFAFWGIMAYFIFR